jgi:hypothetical protein
MMTPNLVENLVDADHNYLGRLNGDIIIGIFQIADYVPVPKPVYDGIIKVVDYGIERLVKKSEPGWQEAKQAAHDPYSKECYETRFGKQLGDFIARSEVSFFKGLTKNTFLYTEIEIPEDTDEIVEEMLKIPLCDNNED